MVVFMADRQKSSSKGSVGVKKSTSSPNVRALAEAENGDVSPADKKRNKLGYHRTAVACGHCRRRKIRCIPSSDTTSTRCQNCIRLKKDCQFFPVDQNAVPPPKRNRTESKTDVTTNGSETSISSSSPRVTTITAIDPYDQFRTQIDTASISQGQDHEYTQSYDHRHWYQTEPPPHQYWLQQDHNNPSSFAPSPYPMTPTTTGQPITSHEHAYTYPAISLNPPGYTFSAQRSREGPISTQPSSMPAFGGFRANTMPDRFGMPDENQRNHDMQQGGISVPSQHILGQSFQSIHESPSQYTPANPHQVWMPAGSESQQHSGNFIQPGPPPTWYAHTDGINGIRDGTSNHHLRETAVQEPIHFRSKPG